MEACSGMTFTLNLRARRGSTFSIWGAEPSGSTSTPNGRSFSSTITRMFSALTVRPKLSLTTRASSS